MIHHDHPQGSIEWRQARVGVVTASRLDDILTPKALKPAKGESYLNLLLAEWMLGAPIESDGGLAQERGVEQEADARRWYEFERSVDVEQVGFFTRDDGKLGASPDGVVGDDGGLEIKVPLAHNHVAYLRDPSALVADYRGEVQGGLLVTGRKWWDLVSFNDKLPKVLVRVLPDAAYLDALAPALDAFLARLDAEKAKLEAARDAAQAVNPFA